MKISPSPKYPRAVEVMTAPADAVTAAETVRQCQGKMRQLHVGCLPVLEGK